MCMRNCLNKPTGSADKTDDIAGSPLQELRRGPAVLIGLIAHDGNAVTRRKRRVHPWRGRRSLCRVRSRFDRLRNLAKIRYAMIALGAQQ
jgi:hypothetical protein